MKEREKGYDEHYRTVLIQVHLTTEATNMQKFDWIVTCLCTVAHFVKYVQVFNNQITLNDTYGCLCVCYIYISALCGPRAIPPSPSTTLSFSIFYLSLSYLLHLSNLCQNNVAQWKKPKTGWLSLLLYVAFTKFTQLQLLRVLFRKSLQYATHKQYYVCFCAQRRFKLPECIKIMFLLQCSHDTHYWIV